MAPIADPILRGVLFVFSAVALALTAAYDHQIIADHIGSHRVNFAVFSAAFSLLFGVFFNGIAAFVEFIPAVFVAVFDFLNMVFLFTGATAIAALIHCHSCGNQEYLDRTFAGRGKSCRLAQASTAFQYFSWAVATFLMIWSIMATVRGGSIGIPGRKRSGAARTGVPTMAQV